MTVSITLIDAMGITSDAGRFSVHTLCVSIHQANETNAVNEHNRQHMKTKSVLVMLNRIEILLLLY